MLAAQTSRPAVRGVACWPFTAQGPGWLGVGGHRNLGHLSRGDGDTTRGEGRWHCGIPQLPEPGLHVYLISQQRSSHRVECLFYRIPGICLEGKKSQSPSFKLFFGIPLSQSCVPLKPEVPSKYQRTFYSYAQESPGVLVSNADFWAPLWKWQFSWSRMGPRHLHSEPGFPPSTLCLQASVWMQMDHRKNKRIPEKHLVLLHWLC